MHSLEIQLEKSLSLSIKKLIDKNDENLQPIAKKLKKKVRFLIYLAENLKNRVFIV
jgi:hypothetical protein